MAGHLSCWRLAVRKTLLIAALSLPVYAVNPCSTAAFQGPYGLQLSGISTISGSPTPFAGLSRLVFDGDGGISGYSSVSFNGLLLANPVTGTYAVQPDCAMSWSLQDDSGNFQHFAGKLDPGGNRVSFRQTDPGAGGLGTIERASGACTDTDLRPSYTLALSGTATPLATGDIPGNFSAQGVLRIEGATRLTLTENLEGRESTSDGAWSMESDCVVRFDFALPVGDGKSAVPMKLRGILVNGGKQILAIQTDPGTVVSARFTAN